MPATEFAERGVVVQGQRLATAMNDAPREMAQRPPLVVLPAAAFAWRDYQPLLERFAGERRVFALDWPGFGASDRPAPAEFEYTAANFAELLGDWLDSLGIARAVLLGNGIGGSAALRYAAAHRARVLGLALVAPLGFGAPTYAGKLAGRALGNPALLRPIEPTLLSLALGPNTATTSVIAERLKAARARPEYVATIAAYAAIQRSLAQEAAELPAIARTVDAPTVVIHGALDALVTAADSRAATAAIGPRGALEIILPDAGHLPFLQQPDPFSRAVAGILNTAEARAAELS